MTKQILEALSFGERHRVIRVILTLIKISVSLTITLLILIAVGGIGGYFYFAHDLPNILSLADYKPPVVSEVFADDGTKIGEFWKERRLLSNVEAMPPHLIRAFIASEDSRFFEHRGIDPRGIARALWEDLKAGSIVQGGSTITQQITRSILLSREQKIGRKIREAILATRLERNLNKHQILTLYLNQIFLGNRAYGVRSAAENYFHKPLKELTLAESALIAGLSRLPADDSPINSRERAKSRQSYVLRRMLDQGYITRDQFEQAFAEPLTIYVAGIDKDFNLKYTPFYTEHVRRMIAEQFGEDFLYGTGLRIDTAVQIDKYRAAETAVRWGLEALDQRQGYRGPLEKGLDKESQAILAEQVHQEALLAAGDQVFHLPETIEDRERASASTPVLPGHNYRAIVTARAGGGLQVRVGHNEGIVDGKHMRSSSRSIDIGDVVEVRPLDSADNAFALTQTPLVQGALFSMEPKTGYVRAMIGGYDYHLSEFNRATQALRQPGSSFKPFVYAAALDKGFTYSTPVADSPVAYRTGVHDVWSPKNYGNSFSGVGAFRDHITNSRNVPTVKIGHAIGLHYLTGFVRKFGLTSPIGKYLSMSLGANGVYVNEIVNAYATFANYGRKPPQVFITRITDTTGKVLFEQLPLSDEPVVNFPYTGGPPTSTDLNAVLWEHGQQWIEKDGLDLDPQEIQVLYGDRIPEGYTITPQTAYLTVGLLQNVVNHGTGRRVLALKRPVAGKTGTTNDETDTWFIGFTPDLAAGVWVGYDVMKRLGRGEQGGRTAAPIFLMYMQEAVKDTPATPFEPPAGFPVAKMASLPGGSSVYWHGGLQELNKEAEEIAERRMIDRSGDFFEEDLGDL